ncbi:uncharacterized protein At5g19025 [Tripterygium wilfordii]|nr:uncharacterized protein At5g19025 [Tripterygium wilfordii]
MVYLQNSISVCNSVDQTSNMANSAGSNELYPKSRNKNHGHRHRKTPNSPNSLKVPVCDRSRSAAAMDVIILIAVIGACGFLLFPYIKFLVIKTLEGCSVIHNLVKGAVMEEPMIYGSVGASTFCAALVSWGLLICTSRKCGNRNCKGLRKAAEFDIQLETEDCVRNSSTSMKGGVKRGLFELPRDHHRELEAELKKMAPPNGRAVLIFRARCGCSVGRLEVPGPKKQRKIKK